MKKPATKKKLASNADKLLQKNPSLVHSDDLKVVSHVQRNLDDWILNTIMIDDYEVPFKFKRKKAYKDLTGASVNITYYPESESVAGVEFEVMHVVRIRKS